MPANLENSAVATGLEKVSFHSNPKERQCQRMLKLPHNCSHLTLAKYCSKFSKPGFSNTWTMNFQMFKLDLFRKGRGTRNQIADIRWIIVNQENTRKTSTSALLTMPKPLTVWITINCGKYIKRWGYQTTWPASWEICMQVKKQQLELDVEQQTGSKFG